MTDLPSPVPAPTLGAVAPDITRGIYGMAFFATLASSDIERSVRWYTESLDFIVLFTIPGPTGTPVLVHLRRWQFQDLLIRPSLGEVVAGNALTLSFAAVLDELDPLADRLNAQHEGAPVRPVDTAWNTRDLTAIDPEGNVIIFTAGRPAELTDATFATRMDGWNREQGLAGSDNHAAGASRAE